MDVSNFCDLLIVSHNEKLYMVEAPLHEANEGDLVEFAPVNTPVLGEVVDKMFCTKVEAEYRCIGLIIPIFPARRIYKVRWEAREGEDRVDS